MANPNPDTSGLKPFEPGQSGNPGGKTAEHRRAEVKAAEIAAQLRLEMLEALQREGMDGSVLDRLGPDALRLFKDSEDRAHGSPKATTEMSGPDGSTIKTEEVGNGAAKVLAALDAINSRASR